MPRFLPALLASLLLLFASCKKNDREALCSQLTEGITVNSMDQVKNVVDRYLLRLDNPDYSAENFGLLAQSLGNGCGISATVLCFDCIETNPSQTEIRVTYPYGAYVLGKTLDFSYNSNHKIVFLAMHD